MLLRVSKRQQCSLLNLMLRPRLTFSSFENKVNMADEETDVRTNELGIQMISKNHQQKIFKREPDKADSKTMEIIKNHLEANGLWGKRSTTTQVVDFPLPQMYGEDLDTHFKTLARQQLSGYVEIAESLLHGDIPEAPKVWSRVPGWTKYDPISKTRLSVPFPEDDGLVFDVELLVKEGNFPCMATAVSTNFWYSWCSPHVITDTYRFSKQPFLSDLIPLETHEKENGMHKNKMRKRIVVGHNVAFDRSFVKEQYFLQKSQLRFMDTMSLHMAVCGQTSFQRVLYQASLKNSNRKKVKEYEQKKKYTETDDEWKEISGMNNLKDVYSLHVGDKVLDKDTRDVFVKGSMSDVRLQYQELMTYCSSDVEATLKIYRKLFPEFLERFPHPVTLSGMLEMGTAYLPINNNWDRYISQSNEAFSNSQRELKLSMMKIANNACQLLENEGYRNDPWLWDLDWSVRNLNTKKAKAVPKKKMKTEPKEEKEETPEERMKRVLETLKDLYKVPTHMPGYPRWYADICQKTSEKDFKVGPSLISTNRRVTPKLLRLTWEGYPLHYSEKYGWGYVVPSEEKLKEDIMDKAQKESVEEVDESSSAKFPTKAVYEFCGKHYPDNILSGTTNYEVMMQKALTNIDSDVNWRERVKHYKKAYIRKPPPGLQETAKKSEPTPGCLFIPLPHKDGANKNVGNPLAKDFMTKFEDGLLQGAPGSEADKMLMLASVCSYWQMNKERICKQLAVKLKEDELSENVIRNEDYSEEDQYGAIIPRVVTAGTVTRRAVEATWLTASNAKPKRIGSELKSMVQTPPGYNFVGADVDSQELWIAAILGDSQFKIHGCTAFGWMNLQGNKADKTDLHSKTAEAVNISRDHAKVFNYSRIYGAGQKFVERLLMQFNHDLSAKDAKLKAIKLYSMTKGTRRKVARLGKNGEEKYESIWVNGSESAMFNKLEAIAKSEKPCTPALGCRMSKALEPQYVGDDFMTSRVNWVVQSSGVDYLHMILVCMNWLIEEYNIDARFCISIHDEVRYIVSEEDSLRAALALQIANLLTRSMFAAKLGMNDLPLSVAFFSAVDIDKCMRKEVFMDCKTPSNPHGMERGYAIPKGKALNIYSILEKTGGDLRPSDKASVI